MKNLIAVPLCILLYYCSHAQTDDVIHGKIPIEPLGWYQLNNVSNGLQQLFDGDLYTRPNTGWGKILSNYDAYYAFPDGMDVEIDSVKLFDWEGTMTLYPATFYAVTGNDWQRKTLATFTGERYNAWDGPYPSRPDTYALDTAFTNVKYIILNSWYEYPTEVEFYGSYKPIAAQIAAAKKYAPLKNFFGVNAFEWDFEDPANPAVIDSVRMKAIKSFTAVRHYMDWQKLESQQGKYTYNPVHSGSWNYDTMYARCKTEGITVLADLKTLPDWMLDTYPVDQRDGENVPVKYGRDFASPASYLEQAKVAFQFAARYGANKNVSRTLVTVDTSQRWNFDDINVVKIGLNLVKYIECDNERDKWWKGRKAYQTGREYAANLSAFYDGHKKTLGAGVGVKNADPKMLVVMGGVASANTDYIRGMIDWCKENRGYNADGTLNLCWDVVNYHLYANDARMANNVWPTTGVAPELSINDSVAARFIQVMHEYANDMPVWITEVGYDINQNSPQRAIPIGNKTAMDTQADWLVRTALTYARTGVQRLFFYQLVDDNPWSGGTYASCGMINDDRSKRPAAEYLTQLNRSFGSYTYQSSAPAGTVVADKYTNAAGAVMHALWLPTQTGNSINYSFDMEGADTAIVYSFQKGSDVMKARRVMPVNGRINLTVSETPVFVLSKFAPAPVSFTGSAVATLAKLQWQTANDSTTASYLIEKSNDGVMFTAIGTLHANKNEAFNNSYNLDDNTPAEGVNYYRLNQIAADSSVIYRQTVAVSFNKPLQLNVYPNPADRFVTVKGLTGNNQASVTLMDIQGKVLDNRTTSADICTFNIDNLAKGVYYINVQAGDKKQTLKFIKAR